MDESIQVRDGIEKLIDENPFKPFVGSLPAFNTREEISQWIRDLRDGDDYTACESTS
jgi:hypothetical protein